MIFLNRAGGTDYAEKANEVKMSRPTIVVCLAQIVVVIAFLGLTSVTLADNNLKQCVDDLGRAAQTSLFGQTRTELTEPKTQQTLSAQAYNICEEVIDRHITREQAIGLYEVFAYRLTYCTGSNLSNRFLQWLEEEEEDGFRSFLATPHKVFCGRTSRAEENGLSKELLPHARWLRVEEFCANVSGLLSAEFAFEMLASKSSVEELASEAQALCSQLRADDINYFDAHYRLGLAMQVFRSQVPSDSAVKAFTGIKTFFSWLFETAVILIGVVGTIVVIVVGTLKLSSKSDPHS